MAKMNVILADEDEVYLEHLAHYFMEKARHFDISTFSSRQNLLKFLSGPVRADVLLFGEEMVCEELEQADISLKLLLSGDGECPEGFESIRKFQKTEDILKEILLKYADSTGNVDVVKGNRKTRTAAFYSPVGGSGKTTIALNTAAACAKAGQRTFYLNLEKVDSSTSILGRTPGSLSEVFLSLKTKKTDVGLKVSSCQGEEPHTRIHYISAPESISEYLEVTGEELDSLIKTLIWLDEYDVLILDFSSGFTQETMMLLENCDVVFTPILSDEFSINRIKNLFHEHELHREYDSLLRKMRLVVNQADTSGISSALSSSGILEQCPLAAVIKRSPTFLNQQNLLRAAEIVRPVFEPLVACIQETEV